MKSNHLALMWLTDPDQQALQPGFVPDAEVPKAKGEEVILEDLVVKGLEWEVVGGEGKGVIVRRGEDLDSQHYAIRLSSGAKVKALSQATAATRRKRDDNRNLGTVQQRNMRFEVNWPSGLESHLLADRSNSRKSIK